MKLKPDHSPTLSVRRSEMVVTNYTATGLLTTSFPRKRESNVWKPSYAGIMVLHHFSNLAACCSWQDVQSTLASFALWQLTQAPIEMSPSR